MYLLLMIVAIVIIMTTMVWVAAAIATMGDKAHKIEMDKIKRTPCTTISIVPTSTIYNRPGTNVNIKQFINHKEVV